MSTRALPVAFRRLLTLVILAACSRDDGTAALRRDLESRNPHTRCAAALRLWEQTGEIEPGLRTLIDDAASDDPRLHAAAALYLPQAKRIPREVIDWVLRAKTGRNAIAALGAIGPAAEPALPTVLLSLADTDPGIRVTAALALFRITRKVDRPVGVLMDELVSAEVFLRRTIADALLEIGRAAPVRFEERMLALAKDEKYAAAADELLQLHRKRRTPAK